MEFGQKKYLKNKLMNDRKIASLANKFKYDFTNESLNMNVCERTKIDNLKWISC